MTKVTILQETLTNYRVDFFEKLSAAKGIELTLVYSPLSQKLKAQSFKEFEPAGKFKSRLMPISTEQTFRYWARMMIYFWRQSPDVVVTGLWMRSLYLLVILKHLFGFKLVFWYGGFPYRDEEKVGKVASELMKRKYFFRPFRVFLDSCDAFVLYSRQAKESMAKYMNIDSRKMFVAPNSPNTDLYFQEKLALNSQHEDIRRLTKIFSPNGERVLLTLGRLDQTRRIDLMLEAFSVVQRQYSQVSLVIIGDGNERPRMEELSAAMGLKNVFFVGEIYDDREIAKYMYLSYSYSGIASMAVKIAMAMGVPVVGFDYGLEVHDIEDGNNGYVVEFGNVNRLAEKILVLLQHTELRDYFGSEAYLKMKTSINIDKMVEGFGQAILHCAL